jgi:type IV secretory pathway VirB10-like protein
LVSDEDEQGPLTVTKGTFGGGGASELWVDNILALEQFLEEAQKKEAKPTRRHLAEAVDVAKKTKSDDATKKKPDTTASEEKMEAATENPTQAPSQGKVKATESPSQSPTTAPDKKKIKAETDSPTLAPKQAEESPSKFPQDRDIDFVGRKICPLLVVHIASATYHRGSTNRLFSQRMTPALQ